MRPRRSRSQRADGPTQPLTARTDWQGQPPREGLAAPLRSEVAQVAQILARGYLRLAARLVPTPARFPKESAIPEGLDVSGQQSHGCGVVNARRAP